MARSLCPVSLLLHLLLAGLSLGQHQQGSEEEERQLAKAMTLPLDQVDKKQAYCLDGSPPLYWFSPGYGSGANKWLVFLEGGGWCNSHADCYQRSQTYLGTSKGLGDLNTTQYLNYFSPDIEKNPTLYNWNQVYVHYCDGASYSGDAPKPYLYKPTGTLLHYAGRRVFDAILDDLMDNLGFGKASEVVVGGLSAGGLGVFLKADTVKARFDGTGTKVVGLPDAGFFLELDIDGCQYASQMRWVAEHQYTAAGTNQGCISVSGNGEEWRCMLAQEVLPYVQTPLFILQSRFDSWQIPNDYCMDYEFDAKGINRLGRRFEGVFRATFEKAAERGHGYLLDSCLHHGWSSGITWGVFDAWNDVKGSQGLSLQQAFAKWYEGSPFTDSLDSKYPCDECCGQDLEEGGGWEFDWPRFQGEAPVRVL